jgi:hypothetical protein
MEEKKGIPWKKIGNATIETIKAIGYGDILLRLRVDKLLPFILYAFVLAMVSIFMSYKAEQTMLRMERNKADLETLRINHSQKTCDLISLDRISTIETMLEELGSNLQPPQKPADKLIK